MFAFKKFIWHGRQYCRRSASRPRQRGGRSAAHAESTWTAGLRVEVLPGTARAPVALPGCAPHNRFVQLIGWK